MQPTVRAPARQVPGIRVLVWALVLGLIGGLLLGVLTDLVARYGPSGSGWSLRGNGALFVPLGIGPAVVGGGWTALALRSAHRERWWQLGVVAGLVGVALIGIGIGKLFVLGLGAGWLDTVTLLAAWAWTVIAPLAALIVTRGSDREVFWHLTAVLMLPLTVVGGFLAAQALSL